MDFYANCVKDNNPIDTQKTVSLSKKSSLVRENSKFPN